MCTHQQRNPVEPIRGLFGKEAFARMRSTAVFINTSRGPVVDQEALYDALAANTIAAAGLGIGNLASALSRFMKREE
jgi:phosphoglycerate dehydrogenase-like enzyme